MTEVIHDERGWHVKVGPFETLADAAQFVAVVDGIRPEDRAYLRIPQLGEVNPDPPALQVHVSDTIDINTAMA